MKANSGNSWQTVEINHKCQRTIIMIIIGLLDIVTCHGRGTGGSNDMNDGCVKFKCWHRSGRTYEPYPAVTCQNDCWPIICFQVTSAQNVSDKKNKHVLLKSFKT